MLAIDFARLDEFLLKAHGVLRIDRVPALGFLHLRRFNARWGNPDMPIARRGHDQFGLVQNIGKRLDVPGPVTWRIGVSDISGNRRLASRKPLGLSRCQVEHIDG